ncbi:MAG TPA: hypothetical protein VH575_30450 [Gemmataceae bacterium]|jgi:hypothetical protein
MQPHTLRLTDPVEALIVEQALALVRQLRQACQTAPHGHVLAQAELVAVAQGRQLSRQALQVAALEAELVAQERGLRSASKRRALAALRDYLGPLVPHSGYAGCLC